MKYRITLGVCCESTAVYERRDRQTDRRERKTTDWWYVQKREMRASGRKREYMTCY